LNSELQIGSDRPEIIVDPNRKIRVAGANRPNASRLGKA